eukprot:TRINITY_DN9477_c0_g1_i5.p1 TRINITY_DN9477_c0_g1~~TRINITY_DN9477_c0_g1_i5.p1  ORF type:complete len:494 (-),score=133.45 TRINITY_DN9477_c0_g1_i5:107-1588(-)
MSRPEFEFYRDEFFFFEQVTAISGVLKPLPTKLARRQRIQEELEKISVIAGLYLPTNPDWSLTSIVLDSGIPLQSAAKVPILVAFMCRPHTHLPHHPPAQYRRRSAPRVSLFSDSDQSDEARRMREEEQQWSECQQFGVTAATATDLDPRRAALATRRTYRTRRQSTATRRALSMAGIELLVEQSPAATSLPNPPRQSATPRIKLITQAAQQAVQQHATSLFRQACIFKVCDDVRQDALALQVIQVFKSIFESVGLGLWLRPYRVIPNRTGSDRTIGGIIECVPHAASRDELGKANDLSLKNYFLSKYGAEESPAFRRAQRNFILSLAGYAVVTYILQVKDRHNGNIMIDDDGHLVHIDFGFIFDISPANDMRFESANFKMTAEMVQLMGASRDSELYRWFLSLCVRGFLAARAHVDDIMALATLLADSGLPCYKPLTLQRLRARFMPERDEKSAATEMINIVRDADDHLTTKIYDVIQWQQQGIYYWKDESS